MEETKSTTTTHYHDSTTRSFPSSPEPTSPSSPAPPSPAAESSLSSDLSDLSHHSSPSHGSSPEQEKSRNPVPPSLNSPAPAYPPARSFPEQVKARNPVQPPGNSTEPEYPPSPEQEEKTRRPDSPPGNSPAYSPPPRSPSPEPMVSRFARGGTEAVRKVDRGPVERERVYGGAAAEGGGGGRRPAGFRRGGKREETVRKVGLGARVCGLVFCLVSFGVMASDKNKGWAVDSFFRYKEFRYCLSVNAIGFVYSFAQASYLAYHLATGEYVFRHPLRHYFDFGMDQILTYFLMSASSSAATRVENWVSNWGPDKFPEMATASVALSYLAFLAFASNSLISGYALSVFRST